MGDSAAARLATGRVALIISGLVLLGALAALDSRRAARRTELEEFVLEPIGPSPGVRQMALEQAYRNSMLWYSASACSIAACVPIVCGQTKRAWQADDCVFRAGVARAR